MNKKGKVLVAGAIALTIVGTTIPQNWHISAASNLISNDDFEEMKSEDIIPYSGTAGDMALSTWYSKMEEQSVILAIMKVNVQPCCHQIQVTHGLDKS